MCSLCFENNLLSSEGVRFALISKKTLLTKLSFAFVSLALPLLDPTINLGQQRKIIIQTQYSPPPPWKLSFTMERSL
jgi:hypothetical protein